MASSMDAPIVAGGYGATSEHEFAKAMADALCAGESVMATVLEPEASAMDSPRSDEAASTPLNLQAMPYYLGVRKL